MKSSYIHSPILFSFLLAAGCSPPHVETAQSEAPKSAHLAAMVNPFPDTFADPAVPLLQLPTSFRAKRTSTNISLGAGKSVDIFNVKGAGCIRHLWFVFAGDSQVNLKDLEIEVSVDGISEPQARMPFRSFFGVLLGFRDYHIDSAGLANFPNFTVTNDPLIPAKASPGWNCYLPIPFSKGCRITLHSKDGAAGASMVDWQQYAEGVSLTPLRFHAQRNIAMPAAPATPFQIAATEGTGFLAGYIMGWRQKDHSDMVFHNGGTLILIDGQTDPHAISGHNVEDDFGFSWGFNQYQTRWAGCPYRDNRGRNDQDGVFYRFFGPDPIPFRSSLLFTSNARPDDYEAVSYFYKTPGSQAPSVVSPNTWQAIGPFADGSTLDAFRQPEDALVGQLSLETLPDRVSHGKTQFPVRKLASKYGWLTLGNIFPSGHSVYVRTTLKSDTDRKAILRLVLDNWALVYLNGKQVAMLDHAEEMEMARVPISLKKGDNQLLIKTNNRMNRDRLLWAIHSAVE